MQQIRWRSHNRSIVKSSLHLHESGVMTRHSAPFTSETARPISILRLDKGSLGRLCNALEIIGFLSQKAGNLAKEAHLLYGLQHPKAEKLIIDSPEGPQLDLDVFTVKELRNLAACLGTKLEGATKKAVIILKVSDDIAGDVPAHASALATGNQVCKGMQGCVSTGFHACAYRVIFDSGQAGAARA